MQKSLLEEIMSLPNKNYTDITISVYSGLKSCYSTENDAHNYISEVYIHGLKDDSFCEQVITKMFKLGFRISSISLETNLTKFKRI